MFRLVALVLLLASPAFAQDRPPPAKTGATDRSTPSPPLGDDPWGEGPPPWDGETPPWGDGPPPWGDGPPPWEGGTPPWGDGPPPWEGGTPPWGDGPPPWGDGPPPWEGGTPPWGDGPPPWEGGRQPDRERVPSAEASLRARALKLLALPPGDPAGVTSRLDALLSARAAERRAERASRERLLASAEAGDPVPALLRQMADHRAARLAAAGELRVLTDALCELLTPVQQGELVGLGLIE